MARVENTKALKLSEVKPSWVMTSSGVWRYSWVAERNEDTTGKKAIETLRMYLCACCPCGYCNGPRMVAGHATEKKAVVL